MCAQDIQVQEYGECPEFDPSESWLQMLKDQDVARIMEKEGVDRKVAEMIFEARRKKEAETILEERRARRQSRKKPPKRTLFDYLKET